MGEGFVGGLFGGRLAGGEDGQQAFGAVRLGGLAGSAVGRTAKERIIGSREKGQVK